ncbi:3'-5' exonuclease [Fervidicella metallireducens]|uniref:3'-5' exonuclease n=1 Tax=Fervidicella metallireducens TaxID=655338 RepID=UPI000AF58A89
MDAANKVISNLKDENLVPAKPVIRHGEKVSLIKKENLRSSVEDINKKIKYLKNKGYKTFAIICKTLEECKTVFNSIKNEDYNPYIITGKEKEYRTGVIVVPSYLSKGLEFDVVFISDGSKEKYTTAELDVKLLYVAMTRPLHKLYIYYNSELSSLLEGVQ